MKKGHLHYVSFQATGTNNQAQYNKEKIHAKNTKTYIKIT